MSRRVAVVAHTHWDREWYAPFDSFRTRLLAVMGDLVELLAADEAFEHFLVDGQMAVIDDYLEARPAATTAIARLADAGRLSVGPWYVLMDEFCVSGETITRNLQLGMERAAAFGGAQAVGYLPDMFGHVAQMPQLLRLAGIEHAVVWRGVPASVDRTGFWWVAPDGTRVRAEYLPVGYANGAFLPRDGASLVRRVRAHEAELGAFLASEAWPILFMNGGDHQAPQAWMPEVVAKANAEQDGFRFEQTSLEAYLQSAPTEGLSEVRGELRSGARANVLMGVLSNRVDVKAAAAAAERALERVAEPLAALWLPAELWPGDLVDEAWLEMIRNSAHDSVCACSADEVGRAVLHRYDRATTLAGEVAARALAIAGVATTHVGPVVVNAGPSTRAGVVELLWPGSDSPAGAQVLEQHPAGVEERSGTGGELDRILAELVRDGWLASYGSGNDLAVTATDAGLDVSIRVDPSARQDPAITSELAELWAQAGARRDEPLRVTVQRAATQRIAVRTPPVPGYGWRAWRPEPLDIDPVQAGPNWMDNGAVRVEVDGATGTFSINGLAGLDRLIDGGDEGDTYTYSPPGRDTVVDRPDQVEVAVIESGPVRALLQVQRSYTWPASVKDGARAGSRPVEVFTRLELHAGERFVRVAVNFDNPCRDHRLRAWFPLPRRADSTVAECAYGTVRRGPVEGGPHETPLATHPARRFVTAGGLALVHQGLLEYELVDDGRALALCLLRAVGTLSRPAPAYRPNVAGPALAVPAAQLVGPRSARYAVAVGDDLDPWDVADQTAGLLHVVAGSGTGHLPPAGARLVVEGAQVAALHRRHDRIEVRVFNPGDLSATVSIPGHAGALVDLRGLELARWEDEFPLPARGIATARLDAISLD